MTDQDTANVRDRGERPSEREPLEALHEDERQDAPVQDAGKAGAPNKAAKEGKPEKKRSPWVRIILVVVLLAAIIGAVRYWFLTRNQESTDDAYTDGRAVAIAAHVSGYVTALNVDDNQVVHRGDVLIEIDPRDYVAARDQAQGNLMAIQGQLQGARFASEVARKNFPAQLAQAQANVQAARATLFKAQTDYNRQHGMPKAATTQQEIDASSAALMQAQAQVAQAEAAVQQAIPVQANIGQTDSRTDQLAGQEKQAQAQVDQANLNLSWTKVVAPQDGTVTKRNVELGNLVQSGQSVFSVVTPEVWVTANFKESQLDRMRPSQKVDIRVDAYPHLKLKGHVDSIQLGSGSKFSAFPAENATGNFVKIVQRVPVKIVIDSGLDPNEPLPLGLSVVPKVHLE